MTVEDPPMRLRALLVAAVTTAALACPAANAAGGAVLTVQADTTGSVTFDVAKGTRVDTKQWSLSGKGKYKVAVLDRIVQDRAGAGWNLVLAEVPVLNDHSRITLGAVGESEAVAVPAGRYRLHVVSDAPATLRIPLTGSPARSFRITKASPVQVRYSRSTPSAGPLPPHAVVARSDLRLGSDFVLQVARWRFSQVPGPEHWEVDACIARLRDDCSGDGAGSTGLTIAPDDAAVTVARIQDTIDHQFQGQASSVTHFDGTTRPTEVVHLVVAVPVSTR